MIAKIIYTMVEYEGKLKTSYLDIFKGKYEMKWYHKLLNKIIVWKKKQ